MTETKNKRRKTNAQTLSSQTAKNELHRPTWRLKPNTHRRRRRDSIAELRLRRVGGVNCQIEHTYVRISVSF